MRCHLCGHDGVTRAFAVPASLDGERVTKQLYRCNACSCLSAKIPHHISLRRHYARLPPSYHAPLDVDQQRFTKVARFLTTYCNISASTKVLDVGCGTGALLAQLPECGKFGIEPAEYARSVAQGRGVTMIPPFDSVGGKQTSGSGYRFDVITAIDVIEHTPEAGAFLSSLDGALRRGGLLLLVTGDIQSFSARFGGSRWLYFHFDEHLSFLSEPAITSLLRPRGFSLVAKTWVQNSNINLTYVAGFLKGICKESVLKAMPAAVRQLAESRIDTRFPCFCDNMLLLYRKGAAVHVHG